MYCGEIGISPDIFWFEMTLRQSDNIYKGYIRKVNNSFERDIWVMRELYSLIYNIMAKNRITPQQAFPLSFDKPTTVQNMPLEEFAKILQANFTATNSNG